jgi:DNA polymerase elongation subunit (family B)
MLDHISLENLLFLDIETVSGYKTYEELPDAFKKLWDKKASFIGEEGEEPSSVYKKAGIYAEFGKIICISVGFVFKNEEKVSARIKSFSGDDEKKLLIDFKELIATFSRKKDFTLCAHNGKEFDFPYIARRMLINGIELPNVLDIAGKKPWEVRFADTLELWKFGDFKSYTSLELLAALFEIPTPKDDIDGSMVGEIYYGHNDLPRIVKYCEKDVITIIQLLLKFKGQKPVPEENIEIVG